MYQKTYTGIDNQRCKHVFGTASLTCLLSTVTKLNFHQAIIQKQQVKLFLFVLMVHMPEASWLVPRHAKCMLLLMKHVSPEGKCFYG